MPHRVPYITRLRNHPITSRRLTGRRAALIHPRVVRSCALKIQFLYAGACSPILNSKADPPEVPPATPGTPTEPPPGIPPGNPNPEVPPANA
jgi:hypothetical protein